MKRYILTGTPGVGKTAILHYLEREGYAVVPEAATDVIALHHALGDHEPWNKPSFITAITELQRKRQQQSLAFPGGVQIYDRSPICTYALAIWLGHPIPAPLERELERIEAQSIYEKTILFVQNLGFVTPTEARRISFEESLRFEQVHQDVYTSLGYRCVPIAPGALPDRAAAVKRLLEPEPED